MVLRRIIAAISLGSIVLGSIAGCAFKVQENRKALDLSKAPTYSESNAKQEMAKEKDGITLAVDGNTPYKILYENNDTQSLIVIVKGDNYVCVINCVAKDMYFDMLFDSFNTIINSVKIK